MNKVELHALAHNGRVRSTIAKLKKLGGHTHHYVAVRQGWVSVYSADEPYQVRSEWWLDCLIARGAVSPEQSFTLVEACPSEQGLSWHCIVVEHGVVKRQWTQSQANWFQLSLEQIEQCFLVGNVPGLNGEVCEGATDEELTTIGPYALRTPRRSKVGVVVAVTGLALLAGMGGVAYYTLPEQTPTTTASSTLNVEEVALPSWALYRVALSHAVGSEQAIKQARNLAVYLPELPPEWKASAIVQVDQNLTVKIDRQPQGQLAVMKAWLASRPELGRFAQWSGETVTVRVPLYSGLPYWRDTVLPIEPSWQHLQDTLTTMGASLTLQDVGLDIDATWQTSRWSVTYPNASLLALSDINTLLAALPVGIDNLTLTPTPEQGWDVSFILNLYGGL